MLYSFDTETTGLNVYAGAKPFIFIFTNIYGTKIYSIDEIETVKLLLTDRDNTIIMHNAKFDIEMCLSVGINIQAKIEDTMIMSHLINENIGCNLKESAKYFLNKEKLSDEIDAWFKDRAIKKEDRRYDLLPKDLLYKYAKTDAELTYELYTVLYPKIIDQELTEVYELEKELIPVLIDIRNEGMKVNTELLKSTKEKLEKEIKEIEVEINEITSININSPKQITNYIEETLGIILPYTEKTIENICEYYGVKEADLTNKKISDYVNEFPKKINKRTDVETLNKYKHINFIEKLLNYKLKNKLLSTYIEATLDNTIESYIHPELNSCIATTGRFSCSHPNVQNQIKPDEDSTEEDILNAKIIRDAFIVEDGFINIYIDYKTMEYAVFADYANDELLIDQINSGKDFHQVVADLIVVTRSEAKSINFGILYGMGVKSLAERLHITEAQARLLIEKYYTIMGKAKEFIDKVKKVIQKGRGYIRYRSGRRRRLYPNESYKALNALIQGMCSDIMRKKMVEVSRHLKNKKSKLIMMVHDELIFKIHISELYLIKELKNIMESKTYINKVNLRCDIEWSNTSWSELKHIDELSIPC